MDGRVEAAIKLALARGFQLSPEALDLLSKLEDPVGALGKLLEMEEMRGQLVIRAEDLQRVLGGGAWRGARGRKLARAADYDADVRVLRSIQDMNANPTFEGFHEYFRDRYRRLSRLLRARADMSGVVSIEEARRMEGEEVKVIGLVYEKREIQHDLIVITIEDETGMIDVLATKDHKVVRQAKEVIVDICIGVEGVVRRGRIIASNIVLPEVRRPHPPEDAPPLLAVLTSDLHVGSKLFMERAFRRLLRWLREDELGQAVKYLIVAGDLVDGAGIYPKQEEELSIKDVGKQYEYLARMLEEVPDYVEVILIPGNHDATSPALPYVPPFREYAEPIYELPNVHILSDPALVEIHGVRILISHGRSLDDMIAQTPGGAFTSEGIAAAMRMILRCRHLAPIYGGRTPLAPVPQDHLVIEEEPHVLHMGHVHVCSVSRHHGVLLVNSGTWQQQTNYQRTMGINPTPGLVPLLELDTLEVRLLDFCADRLVG